MESNTSTTGKRVVDLALGREASPSRRRKRLQRLQTSGNAQFDSSWIRKGRGIEELGHQKTKENKSGMRI